MSLHNHIPAKPFYLVRHGESFANKFEYPSGCMDTRLTRLGWAQAREAALIASRLEAKPSIMVASALVRARETAKLIHHYMDCDLKIDRHIGEQHYGAHQGVARHLVHSQYGYDTWWRNPVEGEAFTAFSQRVTNSFSRWLRCYDLPMFVAHGGLFKAFSHNYGQLIHNIPNAGVFLFEPVRKGWTLSRIENHCGENKSVLYSRL